MTKVATQSRARVDRFRTGCIGASGTHCVPSQNVMRRTPIGDPARSESAVALRPRLATGLPLSIQIALSSWYAVGTAASERYRLVRPWSMAKRSRDDINGVIPGLHPNG